MSAMAEIAAAREYRTALESRSVQERERKREEATERVVKDLVDQLTADIPQLKTDDCIEAEAMWPAHVVHDLTAIEAKVRSEMGLDRTVELEVNIEPDDAGDWRVVRATLVA